VYQLNPQEELKRPLLQRFRHGWPRDHHIGNMPNV